MGCDYMVEDNADTTLDEATGLRQFTTNTAVTTRPNGVRLTATDSSYAPLFSLFSDNEITLSASAGAIAQPEATIQFGTTLAAVNPDLLSALIDVDLEVASLGDLADASVTLADLLDIDAGVVTTDDVARVTVNDALDNVSDGVNALARGVIGDVRSALGGQPLSEILSLAGPVGTDASIALGNIVNSAAQLVAADREEAIPLNLDLPGLTVGLRLLEPASTEIGPAGTYDDQNYYTAVRSSQASLEVTIGLELDLLGLGSVANVNVPIAIKLAQGEARLERIDCPTPDDRFYTVTVSADTATAAAAIGSVNSDGSINTGARADVTVLGTTVAELFNDGNAVSTVLGDDRYEAVFDNIDELPLRPRTFEGNQSVRTNDLAALLGDINFDYELLNTGGGGGLLGGGDGSEANQERGFRGRGDRIPRGGLAHGRDGLARGRDDGLAGRDADAGFRRRDGPDGAAAAARADAAHDHDAAADAGTDAAVPGADADADGGHERPVAAGAGCRRRDEPGRHRGETATSLPPRRGQRRRRGHGLDRQRSRGCGPGGQRRQHAAHGVVRRGSQASVAAPRQARSGSEQEKRRG